MTELKTQKNKGSVADYLAAVTDVQKKKDCKLIAAMMRRATGKRATMWGDSIVGFDEYHYESTRSAQKGDWPITGFSSRSGNISIYIMDGLKNYPAIMKKLGKYTNGVSCLKIKKLADVDEKLLENLIERSVVAMRKKYHTTSSRG